MRILFALHYMIEKVGDQYHAHYLRCRFHPEAMLTTLDSGGGIDEGGGFKEVTIACPVCIEENNAAYEKLSRGGT